jgi:hypothetical protein
MDRRQVLTGVLTGMAAKPGRVVTCGVLLIVGMVGFLVRYRAPKRSPSQSPCPSPGFVHLYDPEKQRELLGPVKKCIEKDWYWVQTSEYGPDRKLLRIRSEHDGKIIYDSLDHPFPGTRDAQGRMLRFRTNGRDGEMQEMSYNYDETGTLRSITNDRNSDRTEFREVNGVKMTIYTFDPKIRTRGANNNFDSWESIVFGDGVPTGGSAITTYDERRKTSELRILTADGQLVRQVVRKYDASGRLEEEKTLQQNDGWLALDRMSPERRAALTPQQAQDLIKENANEGLDVHETRYKYDSQGCLIEKRQRLTPGPFEHTTTIYYNSRGDIERKRDTWADNFVSEVRYSYRYDSFNNWTEKVVRTYDSKSNATTSTTRRTITYY